MKRIILVEDDFILSMLLEKQIKKLGYSVAAKVDNAEEAIDLVKKNEIDMVLMDIKLAGKLDGIEAMFLIREFSGIPVIYLTGNADKSTKLRAQKTRPKGYLIKPVNMKLLSQIIIHTMEGDTNGNQ